MSVVATQQDFPPTKSWLDYWEYNQLSRNTDWGVDLTREEFEISAVQKYTSLNPAAEIIMGQRGEMTTKKQIKSGETLYWWGWSTQVNFKSVVLDNQTQATSSKSGLKANWILQNWIQIGNQDLNRPNNYLNFMCQYTDGSNTKTMSPNPLETFAAPGTAGKNIQNSCGTINLATLNRDKNLRFN